MTSQADVENVLKAIKSTAPSTAEDVAVEVEKKGDMPPLLSPALSPDFERPAIVRGFKTSEELATMIFKDLMALEGFPKKRFEVTVYGSNPWNVWLKIGPAAADNIHEKNRLQQLCDVVTERYRRLYNIAT